MDEDLLSVDEMTAVVETLRMGIPRSLVLKAEGISKERYVKIQRSAQAGNEMHRAWLDGLEQAEAFAKVEHMKKLCDSPDWRAREKVLQQIDPSLYSGEQADYEQTYNWMLHVIQQETDKETFSRILDRFATEDPSEEVEGSSSEGQEAKLH